jgi:hypothetical protein
MILKEKATINKNRGKNDKRDRSKKTQLEVDFQSDNK